ncbi:MAG: hypothetical protein HXX08_13845 [Chloroflexi bacterium]|uniref:Uncharacterized protein n=1 Tax=Candidatus Chlorohelix allophototropha TaxID=3003348 RepID=A0A8T7M4D1_9CHLR|nr:hypothetical protein [Chloroflexota bacterium]WJW70064.1 hypothetical protein OZ401_004868 [Chloroflexota bacterium L227-S17]
MDANQINRLILDKISNHELPGYVKEFIREILQHEKGVMDQDSPRYTQVYENLLNKYSRYLMADSE